MTNNNAAKIQFVKGNSYMLRAVSLYDRGVRSEEGVVLFKVGEPSMPGINYPDGADVVALAPFKGGWLCRFSGGEIGYVDSNKVLGSEAAAAYLASKGKVSLKEVNETPKAEQQQLDEVGKWQVAKARVAKARAILTQAITAVEAAELDLGIAVEEEAASRLAAKARAVEMAKELGVEIEVGSEQAAS